MQIVDYKHITGNADFPGLIAIEELDRHKPSAPQFVKLAGLSIKLTKPTAFLYIAGFSMNSSESGLNHTPIDNFQPAIKTGVSHAVHEWIYTFEGKNNLVKVDIMSGTCAAGIQALYEANRLLASREVDEVIIIGSERITQDTKRLFRELRINMLCGDGFVYMKLARGKKHIVDVQWKYKFNLNPFMFEQETLDTLMPGYDVQYVKLHGTGTESNVAAEAGLAKLGIPIIYKREIGHTQGISALVETCILLKDSDIKGKILVTANGVGGFYGAFTLNK